MKKQSDRNQGRQPKPIGDDPLGSFLMEHFKNFAWTWPHRCDLERLAIQCAPNEWPIVGNRELLRALFRLAACPSELKTNGEHAELIITCLKRSPDFVLELMVELRKKLSMCKPHKLAALKRIETGKFSNAEKQERYNLRKLVASTRAEHIEATQWLDQSYNAKLNPPVQGSSATVRKVGKKKPRKD